MSITERNKQIFYILMLFLFPICFAFFSEWVVIEHLLLQKLVFLFVAFVVVTSIYMTLSFILKKKPHLFTTGILGNKYISFIIYAVLLSLFMLLYLLLFNSVSLSPFLNRILTLYLAYPVLFVLILMIYSFVSNIVQETTNNILWISSYAILGILVIFMFL